MSTNIECGHHHHHQMDNNSSTATTTMRKDNNSKIHISAPTSKSSSTATSSSPIPIAPAPASSTNSKYSMEEVWKDICLSSLHNPAKTTAIPSSTEGIIFQEILSPPSRPAQYHSPSHHHDQGLHSSFGSTDRGFFESHGRQPAASTVLSLNTRRAPSLFSLPLPQDHDLDADNLDSSTVEFSILPKKRVPQNEDTNHRNKRMMKNRESAARSRARKQAYTNELEIKVARLMEENAKLRRQQEKLCLEAPVQLPIKHMLCRTSTAPF